MKVALLLGLLLVSAPIMGQTWTWQDSSYISTPSMVLTSSSGATGGVVTIWAWADATNVYLQVDTTKDGDVYIVWNNDVQNPTGVTTADALRIGYVSSNPLVEDGLVENSATANAIFKYSTGKAGDTTADWKLSSEAATPKSYTNKGSGLGFTITVKRAKTVTDSTDYATIKTDGTTNKVWVQQVVGTYGAAAGTTTPTDVIGAATDPKSATVGDLKIKTLRADFAGTFVDITAGLTKAKIAVAAASGATPAVSAKGAAYKDGTDMKVGLAVTVPSGDAYVVLMIGGTDTQPGSKADMVKLKFSGGVVTIVGEATSVAASANDKAIGAATFTAATNWKFATDNTDANRASFKYTATGTLYTVDIKRALAATSPATPGSSVTIGTTDLTFALVASTADITVADGAAPAQSASMGYAKSTVNVAASDAKDSTTTPGGNNNSSGSGSKNSAIVAFSLMLLATLGLFAF